MGVHEPAPVGDDPSKPQKPNHVSFENTSASDMPTEKMLSAGAGDAPNSQVRNRRKLSGRQKSLLADKLENKLEVRDSDSHQGHGHHERPLSLFTAVMSGLVNWMLMFGLCSAYGLIMFAGEHNQMHAALGVKMNIGTSCMVGLLVALYSKINVAIAGPDLNPVVLIGTFVERMEVSIAEALGMESPTSMGGEEVFCFGEHLARNPDKCDEFHNQLRATTIFATAMSSLVFCVLFTSFGSFKITRYMSYIPTSIVEAFLSCVGYKVFLYALKFCNYDPYQFVPAACIGVPLYFMKAFHVGNPGIVMPAGFLVPLALFYVVIYGFMGSDINEARADDLMFPKMSDIPFYKVWTDSIGQPGSIRIDAWLTTLPDLAIMVVVVAMDCLFKVIGTESKMPVKVDKDYEVRLHGLCNIATTLTGSTVGYMQLKFNVINYGVLQNLKDRRGGVAYALLCATCYFITIEPINFMPRFFVGSLLFFAGAGFVCENLWGSSKYLHPTEWLEVLIIALVFIISGQLLFAVIAGGILCGVSFIAKYARVPTIEGHPMRGADLKIVERRGPLLMKNIRHITDSWLLVVRLKGFVFFASAQSLTHHVLSILQSEEEMGVPHYRRLRIIVFDCKLLDGVDASASKALAKLTRDAAEFSVRVLYSSLSSTHKAHFEKGKIIRPGRKDVLTDLDEAVLGVEEMAKAYLGEIGQRWMRLHESFRTNEQILQQRYAFEPFTQIFLSATARIGCPWQYCSKLKIEGHDTVLWKPGDMNGMLYLVHSGAVGLFAELPSDADGADWSSPIAVYKHGWFLNRETIMRMPSKFYGVALEDGELLVWNQEQWWRMACERPLMMSEIWKGVMKQQARDVDTVNLQAGGDDLEEEDQEWDKVTQRASSFLRQTSDVSHDGAGIVGDGTHELPEWVQTAVYNLESARSLGRWGFYTPVEGDAGTLPPLPAMLQKDLEIAFLTYAEDSSGGAKELPKSKVADALMFAGIFNEAQLWKAASGENDSDPPAYGMKEFMALGHSAIMSPLRAKDVASLKKFFNKNADAKSGTLTRSKLTKILRHMLSPNVQPEEVDGIAAAWREGHFGHSSPLDLLAFSAVVSMFIRKYEHCWKMLQGFFEIFGKDSITDTDVLTVDHLTSAKNVSLTQEHAEEMLWSADWRSGGFGEGKHLPWTEFVSAVYLCVNRPRGPLPPPPAIPGLCPNSVAENKPEAAPSPEGEGEGDGTFEDTHTPFVLEPARTTSNLTPHGEQVPVAGHLEPQAVPKEAPTPDIADSERREAEENPLYTVFRDPFGSRLGLIVWRVILGVVIVSVAEIVLEAFLKAERYQEEMKTAKKVWEALEYPITGFFTIELLARVYVAKKTSWRSLRTFTMLFLVLSTLPLYLEAILGAFLSTSNVVYKVVNFLRLARFCRLAVSAPEGKLMAPVCVSLIVVWGIYKQKELTSDY